MNKSALDKINESIQNQLLPFQMAFQAQAGIKVGDRMKLGQNGSRSQEATLLACEAQLSRLMQTENVRGFLCCPSIDNLHVVVEKLIGPFPVCRDKTGVAWLIPYWNIESIVRAPAKCLGEMVFDYPDSKTGEPVSRHVVVTRIEHSQIHGYDNTRNGYRTFDVTKIIKRGTDFI
jgi:hypothetical protein